MDLPCRLIALSYLLLLTILQTASADDRRGTMSVSEGTRFIVAFPQVWASEGEEPLSDPMILYIASQTKAVVRVHTPAAKNDLGSKIDKVYTVDAKSVRAISISRSLMMPSADTGEADMSAVIRGFGIEITSTTPITVATYQAWNGNGEMTHHLPVAAWGKTYSAMCFYNDAFGKTSLQQRPGQVIVIAQADNTVVNIKPTWDTEGGPDCMAIPAGRTGTIELNNGEVFIIKGRTDSALARNSVTDLSGSVITATKPVAVISGHTKVAMMRYPNVLPPPEFTPSALVYSADFIRSTVYDAMLPREMAGTSFVTIPTMYTQRRTVDTAANIGIAYGIEDNRGDVIRFNAIDDGTALWYVSAFGDSVPVRTLRANESFIVPTQIDAALWRTSKPVTCALYGKSWANIIYPKFIGQGDGGKQGARAQQFPVMEHGYPMMEIVPSVDQWTTHGVFRTPDGMDSFLNITFKQGTERQILLDGEPVFASRTHYTVLAGTPYAYVRMPITAGSHTITSNSDTVRWCAWNYGSLDGLLPGRSYGTPVAIATNIPCADTVVLTDVASACSSMTGTASVLPSSGACGALAMIYADSATNCTFTMDNVLETGATTGVFTVKPFDPTRDASCIVRAVTRSGAFVERTYTFAGQPIIEATTSIDFGVISPSASVCREITIANPSTTTPLTLNALHLKGRSAGLTFPTGPIVIAPAEVRALQVCLLLDAGQTFTDTLIAEVDCGTITLTAVKGRANYSVGVHDDVLHATPRILSVVPNPARDVFTLHYAIEAAATIDLVDITGSVVAHMNVDALHSSVTLDAHTIAAGAYTAVLRCSAGVHTMHVIIAP